MKVTKEISLRDFEWWGGAKDRWKYIKWWDTTGLEDYINELIDDCFDGSISETELNDIFWFEEDMIAEQLGFKDFDELMKASYFLMKDEYQQTIESLEEIRID